MELDQQLAEARARRDAAAARARQAASPYTLPRDAAWTEYLAADAAVLAAERELAASKHEEHAVPLEFPVRWDTGAPLPQLLVNDHRALLLFRIKTIDPNWDGTYATMKSAGSDQRERLALVEFERCHSAKLGSPNDEVLEGHPLAGKGLDAYTAQRVVNSRWLAEIQKINSVHAGYRPDAWTKVHHYVLWFHDTTFECLAESFTVGVHECSMPDLLASACRRLVS